DLTNADCATQPKVRVAWPRRVVLTQERLSGCEVPPRRTAAEALWRAGGCAVRDDTHSQLLRGSNAYFAATRTTHVECGWDPVLGRRFFHAWNRCGFDLERLTHRIASKTPDHDVLTKRCDLARDQLLHRLIRILDEPLLHQANR